MVEKVLNVVSLRDLVSLLGGWGPYYVLDWNDVAAEGDDPLREIELGWDVHGDQVIVELAVVLFQELHEHLAVLSETRKA